MNICDLCSTPLTSNATRYTASQMRRAVKAGLRPNSTSFELGAALGMSKQVTEQGWIQQVMTDNSDWLLCTDCTKIYKRFAALL